MTEWTQGERDAIANMAADEAALLAALHTLALSPRDGGHKIGTHPKRVEKLCWKWTDRGWYEYGVAADLGWLTERGHEVAHEVVERHARRGA